MIGQIDWRWRRRWSSELHQECVILGQLVSDCRNYSPRISTQILWIQMSHDDLVSMLECRPIEFVEANETAMQMMQVVPVLVHMILFAVQRKFSAVDAIANTTNRCTKVRIAIRLNAYKRITYLIELYILLVYFVVIQIQFVIYCWKSNSIYSTIA